MTDMKVEDGHCVLTPGNQTLTLKAATGVRNPHLFAEGLRYRSLLYNNICGPGAATTLFRS
jgi:hypothetical protein